MHFGCPRKSGDTDMITILMATYNGAEYLAAQMDSILHQTVQDFCLIVYDDGSTDDTFSILKAYQKKYPNQIRCIQNEFPTGSAKGNFFLMLKDLKAKQAGEYIIFADQDDVWEKDKLEKLQEHLKGMEMRYGKSTPLLVYSDLKVADENLRVLHPSMQQWMHHPNRAKNLGALLVENDVTGNSMMFNQSLLDIYFEPTDAVMHDWYLAILANVFGHMSYLEESLTLYRQHQSNALGVKKSGVLQTMLGNFFQSKERKQAIQKTYAQMFAQAESVLQYAGQIENILRKKQDGIEKQTKEIGKDSIEKLTKVTGKDSVEKQMKEKCRVGIEKETSRRIQTLRAFVSIRSRTRIGKIVTICRYRFFKSRWWMTLGQCFHI